MLDRGTTGSRPRGYTRRRLARRLSPSADVERQSFVLADINRIGPTLGQAFDQVGDPGAAIALSELLHAQAVAIADTIEVVSSSEVADHRHDSLVIGLSQGVLRSGRLETAPVVCGDLGCTVRAAIIAPIVVDGVVAGAIVAFHDDIEASLVQQVREAATLTSDRIAFHELAAARASVVGLQLTALRAQMSPHFVYNALTAIASFTHQDPAQARTLLLKFAEFTRYRLSTHGLFSTMADELRAADTYLELERARFGPRLEVTVQVDPDILSVALPFLTVQPLVENALRHGLEAQPGSAHLRITVTDGGDEAIITIEDDGVGVEPDLLATQLRSGEDDGHLGLRSVDNRLRAAFGPEYGVIVDTAPGAGTMITLRIPKSLPGVAS
jgi:two-component system, LytTR family, sensor kinase